MRQKMITPALYRRVTSRANLGILLLVGGVFALFGAASGPPGLRLESLVWPFLLLFVHLALDPVPWQWTGGDAPMAGMGRGFLQALVFDLVWVALLLAALHIGGGPHGPPGLRPPLPGPPHMPPPEPPGLRIPNLGPVLVNLAFAIVFGWVFAEKEATEARERLTAGLLRQSRRQALQSQLEPHVLYNALNSLSELVHEDPAAAEEMVARLADLYRMLTRHGDADLVPLMKERVLVEAYLAMEEMRLGHRLRVDWDWPPWADGLVLPPLLLQPLVENAVKHGISPCEAGGALRITCSRDESTCVLAVANTGRPMPATARDGVGLTNLRARLELWPEAAVGAFTLAQEGEWTVARLRWNGRTP